VLAVLVVLATTTMPPESQDVRQAHADVKDLTLQYNTLCDECDALDVTKATLEADVFALAQRQAVLQSDLQTVQDSIPVASQALCNARKQNDDEMTQSNGRLQDILYTIDSKTAHLQAIQTQRDQLLVDVTLYTQQHCELLEKISDSRMVLDNVRAQHSEATEHLILSQHEHTEQLRSSRAEQEHMRDVLAGLERSVTHLREQESNLQHDLQHTEHPHTPEACTLATRQLAHGNAVPQECTQALAQKNTEVAAVQTQLLLLCRTLDDKQLALVQLDLACEKRERQSTMVHERAALDLDEVRASLAQGIRDISDKSAELVHVEERIGQSRAVLEGMTAEICQQQASLLTYKQDVSEKEFELHRLQGELQNTLAEIDDMRAEASALSAQGVCVHAELSTVQTQLHDCKQELLDYQRDLTGCSTEVDGMEEYVVKHNTLAATLQAQQNAATEQYAACQEQITEYMAQLDVLEQDLLQKKDSLETTRRALEAGEKHAQEQQALCVAVAQKHTDGVAKLEQIQDDIIHCTAELEALHARIASSNTRTTGVMPKISTQDADDDEFEALLMSFADADMALNDTSSDAQSQDVVQSQNTRQHTRASVELVNAIQTQEQAQQVAANAVSECQQQHTATSDELCDLQRQIGAARDELLAKNADLKVLQQHIAQHAVHEKQLQKQNSQMSAALREVQTAVVQHEHASAVLVAAIQDQETTLHDSESAVLASHQQNATKNDEMLAMQQKTEALGKKHLKSKKELARVQLQTKEASEAHAVIQTRMEHDTAAVLCTQNNLLGLEAAQLRHEAETAQHLVQLAQQLAQRNEMQASVDCMMHKKQTILESIEVLSLSNTEYEQKLHRIQHYSNSLNMGMNQLRESMHMHTHSAEFHVSIAAILDLFGCFLDWFESTFTARLYDFSCLLLNSRVE